MDFHRRISSAPTPLVTPTNTPEAPSHTYTKCLPCPRQPRSLHRHMYTHPPYCRTYIKSLTQRYNHFNLFVTCPGRQNSAPALSPGGQKTTTAAPVVHCHCPPHALSTWKPTVASWARNLRRPARMRYARGLPSCGRPCRQPPAAPKAWRRAGSPSCCRPSTLRNQSYGPLAVCLYPANTCTHQEMCWTGEGHAPNQGHPCRTRCWTSDLGWRW
mmetsp:Transcript_37198/g.93392  ORF Transcript_37198/g.93392 Transcript_37198/m.93392 type:complete len:214 (+) Transcript_37198:1238-1879(+)